MLFILHVLRDLEELRAKATPGEWVVDEYANQGDEQYIVALHNSFPILAQAIREVVKEEKVKRINITPKSRAYEELGWRSREATRPVSAL